MMAKSARFVMVLAITLGMGALVVPQSLAQARPEVIELNLSQMVQPVSAEYVVRGIRYANQKGAAAGKPSTYFFISGVSQASGRTAT